MRAKAWGVREGVALIKHLLQLLANGMAWHTRWKVNEDKRDGEMKKKKGRRDESWTANEKRESKEDGNRRWVTLWHPLTKRIVCLTYSIHIYKLTRWTNIRSMWTLRAYFRPTTDTTSGQPTNHPYICVLKGIPEYILHMLYCRLILDTICYTNLALSLSERAKTHLCCVPFSCYKRGRWILWVIFDSTKYVSPARTRDKQTFSPNCPRQSAIFAASLPTISFSTLN